MLKKSEMIVILSWVLTSFMSPTIYMRSFVFCHDSQGLCKMHFPDYPKAIFKLAVKRNSSHAKQCITRRKVQGKLHAAITNNASREKQRGELDLQLNLEKCLLHHTTISNLPNSIKNTETDKEATMSRTSGPRLAGPRLRSSQPRPVVAGRGFAPQLQSVQRKKKRDQVIILA